MGDPISDDRRLDICEDPSIMADAFHAYGFRLLRAPSATAKTAKAVAARSALAAVEENSSRIAIKLPNAMTATRAIAARCLRFCICNYGGHASEHSDAAAHITVCQLLSVRS